MPPTDRPIPPPRKCQPVYRAQPPYETRNGHGFFAVIAAGAWGALRPVEQLQQIFGYRNAYLFPERVFLPNVNDLLDERGQLKDPDIADRLKKQAAGFADFVQRLKGISCQTG